MNRADKCAQCGSTAIVHRAMVVQHYPPGGAERKISLRVDGDPSAFFRKKAARSNLRAEVCSACGYVEFYAEDPAVLIAAYNQSQQP